MRRPAAAASQLLLAGCMIGQPAPAPPAPGPPLVLDVANESASEHILGYEFESAGMSGGGESIVAPCRREAMAFTSIDGDYSVQVDGKTVSEGTVPSELGEAAIVVIRVRVGPDGDVEVAAPIVVAAAPGVSAAIPCG